MCWFKYRYPPDGDTLCLWRSCPCWGAPWPPPSFLRSTPLRWGGCIAGGGESRTSPGRVIRRQKRTWRRATCVPSQHSHQIRRLLWRKNTLICADDRSKVKQVHFNQSEPKRNWSKLNIGGSSKRHTKTGSNTASYRQIQSRILIDKSSMFFTSCEDLDCGENVQQRKKILSWFYLSWGTIVAEKVFDSHKQHLLA